METTLEETKKLADYLKTESSAISRSHIYKSQARFKSPDTDQILKKLMKEFKELDKINSLVKYGIKYYNRYDFLPTLDILKKKAQAEKDITKKGSAEKILATLKLVIPYLEQKKKESYYSGTP